MDHFGLLIGDFWCFRKDFRRFFPNRIFKTKWPPLGIQKWSKKCLCKKKSSYNPLKLIRTKNHQYLLKMAEIEGGSFWPPLGICLSILKLVMLGLTPASSRGVKQLSLLSISIIFYQLVLKSQYREKLLHFKYFKMLII